MFNNMIQPYSIVDLVCKLYFGTCFRYEIGEIKCGCAEPINNPLISVAHNSLIHNIASDIGDSILLCYMYL